VKDDISSKSMLHVVLRVCRAPDGKVLGSYISLPNTMYTILELAVLDAGLLGRPDCSRATSRKCGVRRLISHGKLEIDEKAHGAEATCSSVQNYPQYSTPYGVRPVRHGYDWDRRSSGLFTGGIVQLAWGPLQTMLYWVCQGNQEQTKLRSF
jgi:hypothetical protein